MSSVKESTCATIGFFDGVHLGHRFLIEQLKEQARLSGLKSAVVTFRQHPRQILQSNYQPQLLSSLDERLQRLHATGVDYCHVLDFTPELAATSAKDFIQEILHKQLHVKELLIGHDHRFGKGRTDDFQNYVEYGADCGMNVQLAVTSYQLPVALRHCGLDPQSPVGSAPVNSTAIRNAIIEGNMLIANQMLGYTYALTGKVIVGDRIGHTIGFPTANLELAEPLKVLPKEGAYAVRVHPADGQTNAGMAYIGRRPSVAQKEELRIEVHLFDFCEDLYGQILRVEFVDFLRPSAKFPNIVALKAQLGEDVLKTKKLLTS
ncbi:riboflavin biosynthesis protein [Bacteroidia bacterium]|nr:riboflavin biosynthesis protein [Bacteroidia bacterium]